jgi:hypothetical protein
MSWTFLPACHVTEGGNDDNHRSRPGEEDVHLASGGQTTARLFLFVRLSRTKTLKRMQ